MDNNKEFFTLITIHKFKERISDLNRLYTLTKLQNNNCSNEFIAGQNPTINICRAKLFWLHLLEVLLLKE